MRQMLLVLFLLPWMAKAQDNRQSTMNGQADQMLLQTQPVTIKAAADINMEVSLRAAGPAFFLKLEGKGTGAHTINSNDPAIFLLANDSTVTVNSIAVQGYDEINSTKTYQHEYAISQEGLESLSCHPVQAVRKHSVLGYDDIYVDPRDGERLKGLCAGFLQSLERERLLKPKPKPAAPAFPGGREVWLSFLNKNLQALPLLQAGEQKKALIQFQVSAEGSISDLQIKQSAGALYDNELLRILKRMPLWKPSVDKGKPVAAIVSQQVNFYQEEARVRVRF